ncbi:MAG: hypothetical protein E7051_06585 [Lentisphaerae bacterium]|nr:hypothetical protein [Lentisphaerota bacterium]
MIENWFTNKCMTLIGINGRALAGEDLKVAERAIEAARMANHKLWTDRNGNFYHKERTLFASARPLIDGNGKPVRICGRMVKIKAKFCSKCGGSAPGSWWRCGGCGKLIGNESQTCPHCGRTQNPMMRLDISDGSWRKEEEIFAERFELQDIAPLMQKGLNVQESQNAVLLEGGAVTDVLSAGFYKTPDFENNEGGDKSLVMVDCSEFSLPVCVESIRTADDIEADLHVVAVLRFDPANAKEFMCNLMGSSLYLKQDALTASLGYDEIAHCLLGDIDTAAREMCNTTTVAELFKSADTRIKLENHIANSLARNLSAIGMSFVRLKEVEFESEVFTKLREMSGQVETKRREIEFMQRADELANDATRREAMSEYEMEDFMDQLAHEKGIKDDLRVQEIERLRKNWERSQEKDALSHEHDLDDIQQMRQLERDRTDAEFKQEMIDLEHKRDIERRIAEQNASLEFTQIESRIQNIKIEVAAKKAAAEQDAADKWLDIKQKKQAFNQNQKIDMIKAAQGADISALIMAEDDPDKRRDLLELYEQQQQAKMTPELLLAAAAARGNAAAAAALAGMNKDQLDVIERAKNENKEIFEKMLQMNERMFNQATENMAKNNGGSNTTTTTQIIK